MKNNKFNLAQVKLRALLLVLVGVFVLALSLLGVGLGYAALAQRQSAGDLASMSTVRDLLVRAIEGSKMPAVIDAKTGDVYFPPTKYYVPAASTAGLTYAYDKDQGLSVSTKPVLGEATSWFYNAASVNQLFAGVPHAQACQRGVRVSETQLNDSNLELKQTLKPGATSVYLYAEKQCVQLQDVVTILKDLKTY
jgi:hypothetical protein